MRRSENRRHIDHDDLRFYHVYLLTYTVQYLIGTTASSVSQDTRHFKSVNTEQKSSIGSDDDESKYKGEAGMAKFRG